MKINDNFASFRDPVSNKFVFVESHDNSAFNVRVGSMMESNFIGTVHADSNKDLNTKLEKIVKKVQR
jgi:hypothetical protein